MTKYTFLLPAWKADYLEEMLNSIKAQTYTNYKVIVSDDASPAPIRKVFDIVVGSDERFTYRRNEKNIGGKDLVAHWMLLVDMCDTEFFIMASDDDVYAPTFLEEIDALMQKYPTANVFRGRARWIDGNGKVLRNECVFPEFLDQRHFLYYNSSSMYIWCEANYCYRTEAFKRAGGYVYFPMALSSDDATHIRMARNGCAITKDVLFSFRCSGINVSQSLDDSNAILRVKAILMFISWVRKEANLMGTDSSESCIVQYALDRMEASLTNYMKEALPRLSFRDFRYYLRLAHQELNIQRSSYILEWLKIQKSKMFRKIGGVL